MLTGQTIAALSTVRRVLWPSISHAPEVKAVLVHGLEKDSVSESVHLLSGAGSSFDLNPNEDQKIQQHLAMPARRT